MTSRRRSDAAGVRSPSRPTPDGARVTRDRAPTGSGCSPTPPRCSPCSGRRSRGRAGLDPGRRRRLRVGGRRRPPRPGGAAAAVRWRSSTGRVDAGARRLRARGRRDAWRRRSPYGPTRRAHATVLEVRADDRPGVVHLVCSALAGSTSRSGSAHVDTLGPQAVDVFYVQEPRAGVAGRPPRRGGRARRTRRPDGGVATVAADQRRPLYPGACCCTYPCQGPRMAGAPSSAPTCAEPDARDGHIHVRHAGPEGTYRWSLGHRVPSDRRCVTVPRDRAPSRRPTSSRCHAGPERRPSDRREHLVSARSPRPARPGWSRSDVGPGRVAS